MNNLVKLGSATLLLLAGSQLPVFAQDTSSSAETSSSMSSSSSGEVSSSESSTVDYGQIISALEAGKVADITAITEESAINLVLVSDLKANGDAAALQTTIDKLGDGAATLKANADTNATLKDKVVAAGYTTDLIVAVLATDDGSFTVVVNDEHP